MSHFDASRMLSFDLETTSTDPLQARIVTSALVSIDGSSVDTTEMLADPGIEIPPETTEVHGISTEKARAEGRPHEEVLRESIERIQAGWEKGLTLVVFNAAYDLTILAAQSKGEFTVTGPVYDPLVVDKILDPYRKGGRKLGKLAADYGLSLDNAHNASADAMAAARIAWKQVRQWPQLKEKSFEELMEFQAVGYYESQKRLKGWLESRGKNADDVNFSWPMQGVD